MSYLDYRDRRAALAAAALRRLTRRGARRRAVIFDLLGLARPAALLPDRLRHPHAVAVYGVDVWRPLTALHRRALDGARTRWAISRHTIERARPFTGPLAFDLLPLCLEEREPSGRLDTAVLERAGRGFFLLVGRMAASERYKGHDLLLETVAADSRRRASRLVFAGDGDDRRRLERRAIELGLGDRVLFTGFVSEATIAALHERALAFVMPSTGEGFGLVYLEAMRAGRPCVAARGSAAEEIVVEGETGLLVDAASGGALGEALARLEGEPVWADRLGAAGRERLRRDFTFERFARRLEPGLEALVGAAGATATATAAPTVPEATPHVRH